MLIFKKFTDIKIVTIALFLGLEFTCLFLLITVIYYYNYYYMTTELFVVFLLFYYYIFLLLIVTFVPTHIHVPMYMHAL